MIEIAVALLKTKDGKYVFQRRTKDAPVSAGLLSFFGGHMEVGEEAREAVTRELNEETSLGLGKDDFKHLKTETFINPELKKHIKFSLFVAKIKDDKFDIFEGDGKEVCEIENFLKRDDIALGTRFMLEKIKQEGLI